MFRCIVLRRSNIGDEKFDMILCVCVCVYVYGLCVRMFKSHLSGSENGIF